MYELRSIMEALEPIRIQSAQIAYRELAHAIHMERAL